MRGCSEALCVFSRKPEFNAASATKKGRKVCGSIGETGGQGAEQYGSKFSNCH
jgi:hypothetical protein